MNIEIARSIARNTTIQIGQQIVTWISTFVLMLFLPRYLGPVDYGRLFLAMSIGGIFLIPIDYDGRLGIAKRISRSPESASTIITSAVVYRLVF